MQNTDPVLPPQRQKESFEQVEQLNYNKGLPKQIVAQATTPAFSETINQIHPANPCSLRRELEESKDDDDTLTEGSKLSGDDESSEDREESEEEEDHPEFIKDGDHNDFYQDKKSTNFADVAGQMQAQ